MYTRSRVPIGIESLTCEQRQRLEPLLHRLAKENPRTSVYVTQTYEAVTTYPEGVQTATRYCAVQVGNERRPRRFRWNGTYWRRP